MDIWRLLAAVIRRWYIIIPLLIATAVAAATAGRWVEPEYTTSAVIAIVPGKAPTQDPGDAPTATNPYNAVSFSTGVLQYVLNSSGVRQELLTNGVAGSYQIKAVPRSSFLGIEATANDPEVAIATGRGVIEGARKVLRERQAAAGTPATAYASIEVLDDADSVAASGSGQLQAQAALLAVGGIISVILTVLTDDLLLLRRRRHGREADVETTPSGNGAVGAAVRPSHRARG